MKTLIRLLLKDLGLHYLSRPVCAKSKDYYRTKMLSLLNDQNIMSKILNMPFLSFLLLWNK